MTKFDTHFDTERPWKCFFHDRQSLVDSSRPTGLSNLPEYAEEGFTKDYAYQHSRPMLGPCVDSKFTLPMGTFPSTSSNFVHNLMARMKWKDYDPDVWVDQLVIIDLSYEFAYPIGGTDHVLNMFIGDEHDDPDQTYTTTAKAWPNIWLNLRREHTSSTNLVIGNIYFSDPEAAVSAPGTIIRRPAGSSPSQFTDTLQAAEIHLELEIKAAETRVRGTYAGQTMHFSGAGSPSEFIRGSRPVRFSPRFRVGVHGQSVSITPAAPIQPLKVDRWAVSTEPL